MRRALHVAKAQAYRELRTRSNWVLVLLLGLVPAARVLAWRLAEAPERLQRARSGDALTDEELAGLGWAPFVESWRFGLVLGALVLLFHVARGIAGDRDTGVARLAITRSASRTSLVFGRALLAPLHVLGLVALTGASAWLAVRSWYGLGDLVVDGYTLMTADELLRALVISVAVTLPALLALACFGLFVSSIARSAVTAVGVAATAFIAYDLFKELLGDYAPFVFATWVPSIFKGSAMSEMVQVALGYSDAGLTEGAIRAATILPWAWSLGLLLLAAWAVARKRL